MDHQYKYNLAISFAEEDRNIAHTIALALELQGFENIYYYPDSRAAGLGEDLEKSLTRIFLLEAKYALVLFSTNYVQKAYAKIELAAIQKRIKLVPGKTYLLPIIVDIAAYTKIDIGHKSVGYIEWKNNPKEIARTIAELFGNKQPRKDNQTNIINGDFPIIMLGHSWINNITQNTKSQDGK